MGWVRLDDHFADHPKIAEIGAKGIATHIRGFCYASRYLTDGFLSDAVVTLLLAPEIADEQMRQTIRSMDESSHHLPDKLVAVGLWKRVRGGYLIHDYLLYNPSKEQVVAERERKRKIRTSSGIPEDVRRNSDGISPSPTPSPPVVPKVVGTSKARGTRVVEADAEFLAALKDNPAYKGIDLEQEIGRMRGWLLTPRAKGRKLTRQFIVNWLNKVDRPIEGGGAGWHPGRHER